MKWKIGNRLVFGGFVIATGILVFVGWQSYQNTARFAEASEWRKHTYEVLGILDQTVARLVDAETGQRGYVITGDPNLFGRVYIATNGRGIIYGDGN